jgi:hypothetical protein
MLGDSYFRFDFWGTSPLDCNSNFPLVNQWAFWTFTYDSGTNSRKMYLNGNLICSDNPSSNCLSVGDVLLGRVTFDNPLNVHYHGVMDEVRIYNRALTDQEVDQLSLAGEPRVDITTGLVAHYPFDGDANDVSGNNLNGIVNGASKTKDRFGAASSAFHFDGINDWIETPYIENPATGFSVSVWVRTNAQYAGPGFHDPYIIENRGPVGGGGYGFSLQYDIGTLAAWSFGVDGDAIRIDRYKPYINNNKWIHLVGTFEADGAAQFNNSQLKLYVNGSPAGTYDYDFGGAASQSINPIGIMKIGWHEAGNVYFEGDIDDLRIYNRALSGTDVTALYGNYVSPETTPPQITISAASISVGQSTTISGSGFKENGKVRISFFYSGAGYNLPDWLVDADASGAFSFPFSPTADYPAGFYSVTAVEDISNYGTIGSRMLQITNGGQSSPKDYLSIQSPNPIKNYHTNSTINISWNDKITADRAKDNSGYYYYKIEVSSNGIDWTEIKVIGQPGIVNEMNYFIFPNLSLNTPGNYQIRISDNSDPSYSVTSEVFKVLDKPITGFDYSMEWDKSNDVITNTKVQGVAADGAARFYFKITKKSDNPKKITKVSISLSDPENVTQDIKFLGKVKPVSNLDATTNYSLEANDIVAIDAETTNPTKPANPTNSLTYNDYWFWYVAPDDFNREISTDNFKGIRIVKAKIDVYYENETDPETIDQDIEIVRPPLMLVHGIGGNKDTWKGTVFENINGIYSHLNIADNLFQAGIQINELYPSAEFIENAKLLLGIDPLASPSVLITNLYKNAFQNILTIAKKEKGIAANRVDYVCHSMGGCVLRTAINFFKEQYIPKIGSFGFKNYEIGFVNKLITLNTPHNGSPGADLITDVAPKLNSFIRQKLHDYYSKDNLTGVFLNESFDKKITKIFKSLNNDVYTKEIDLFKYNATPAVKNMRYFLTSKSTGEGVRFTETKVKNHLIAGQVAANSTNAIKYIESKFQKIGGVKLDIGILVITALDYKYGAKNLKKTLFELPSVITHDFANIIMKDYGNPDFMEQSDFVVPVSSQLPGKSITSLGNNSTLFPPDPKFMHTDVTDAVEVGNRIIEVLNKPISSDYFANTIAANDNLGEIIDPKLSYKPTSGSSIANATDSLVEYFDTTKIKIITPTYLSTGKIDSSFTVKLNLKDTANYKRTILIFQGEQYNTSSFADTLTFNLKVSPALIDSQIVMVAALYDSVGFSVYHYDLTKIIIKPDSLCQQLIVSPETKFLNPGEKYIPTLNGIHPTYITSISITDPASSFNIADSNVIRYDSVMNRFIAKDTGSTIIVFDYKGFKDTLLIYLTIPTIDISYTPKICPGQTIIYTTDDIQGATYQWQVDSGNGFTNLSNDAVYSGATTNTLTITNIPTSNRGNKYQCITVNGPGSIYSDTKTLQFGVTWNGTTNTDWSNPANWNCNVIPDENVHVIIPTGKLNYPTVNSNVNVNSLKLEKGAKVTVAPGALINVKSKQ